MRTHIQRQAPRLPIQCVNRDYGTQTVSMVLDTITGFYRAAFDLDIPECRKEAEKELASELSALLHVNFRVKQAHQLLG